MCAALSSDVRQSAARKTAPSERPAPSDDLTDAFSKYRIDQLPAIVAAVSGGSDSVALLLLLKDWLAAKSSATRLIAVTIDHRLRHESANEAAEVSSFSARLDVEHRVLAWEGPKPRTGLIAAARTARYRLLGQAAAEAGAPVILTAHTADDQAETVFMRAKRGDGLGLAGMAPATLVDETHWLLRPLLDARREALRAYLARIAVGWIDDPTNVNTQYERARIRAELTSDPRKFEELIALADAKAELRVSLAQRAAELISRHLRQPSAGLFHLAPEFAKADDREAANHAFRYLLATAGGTPHAPEYDRTSRLLAQALAGPNRYSISRCIVAVRGDGIWLCREIRGLPPPEEFTSAMDWDGRFRIATSGRIQGSVMAAGVEQARKVAVDERLPKSLARTALATRPAIHSTCGDGSRQAVATPIVASFRHFLPAFDLPLAQALASLVGAAEYPAPPCTGHIVTQA